MAEEFRQALPGDILAGSVVGDEPIHDKIKEARREEDETPQGDWARAGRLAEWPAVIRLASETTATKSKDLQVAAWLLEAELRQEGFSGLRSGLELIHGLLEKYWDTLYPPIEDGDAELRAAPLSWIGLKQDIPVKSALVVHASYDSFKYTEAQT